MYIRIDYMGAFGYIETVWVVSEECVLFKVITNRKSYFCHVCRMKIKTKTCFEFDENHHRINESFLFPPERTCWNCARKLVVNKEIASRY